MTEQKSCVRCGKSHLRIVGELCINCYQNDQYYKHYEKKLEEQRIYRNKPEVVIRLKVYHSDPLIMAKKRERWLSEEHKKKHREYHALHLEEIKLKGLIRRRTENYRFLGRLRTSKRRDKMKQISHSFSYDEWLDKLRETCGVCPECNEYIGESKLTIDHILPISKAPIGFVYSINDVQPLCQTCNARKRDKIEMKSIIEINGGKIK